LLFSPVISEHFSKNRMIISVVAAKIWHLQKCTVFIGPPCTGGEIVMDHGVFSSGSVDHDSSHLARNPPAAPSAPPLFTKGKLKLHILCSVIHLQSS